MPATEKEVRAAYEAATDRHDRERLLAIRLWLRQELSSRRIADTVMHGRSTVCRWVRAFREGGIAKLLEREHTGRGPSLTEAVQDKLRDGLESGRWRSADAIRIWLAEEHQIKLKPGGVGYWLRKVKARPKVPRPSHAKKDADEVAEFQAQFDQKLSALADPQRRELHIWVEDEHRYGLNSIIRRVWSLPKVRPVVPYQKRREWADLYGALDVGTGRAEFLYTPGVLLEWTYAFLEQLAATDPAGLHVVIWDGAGWHPLPGDPKLPEAVRVLPLPAYSPELNPIEPLWEQVKEAVANVAWQTLKQAESVIDGVLKSFLESEERVRSLLGRNWTTCAVLRFLRHPSSAEAM
jgi:transposase